MTKPFSTVATALLTFTVTLVLNTALNYYSSDKGSISISRSIVVDGKAMTILTIENFTRNFIEGVAVEIPISAPISTFATDSPVTFTDAPQPYHVDTRIVKFGQISPRMVTHIFIPTSGLSATPPVRIANLDAVGLTLRRDDELESPLRKALLEALLIASIYTVFAIGVGYYTDKRTKLLQNSLNKLEEEVKVSKKRVNEFETRIQKHRLLLQARLFDYAKELEFWRNAFRTLVMKGQGEMMSADNVINAVTTALKTHGTNDHVHSFESIRVAAAWLTEAEKAPKSVADATIANNT